MMQRFVPSLLGVLLTAVVASAQQMTVTAGVLRQGQSVDITYSDPARPLGVIVVTIDDGAYPVPNIVEVVIHLDARGNGTAVWTVPGWLNAAFNANGVREQTRFIQ